MTCELLVGTDGVQKMSKSLGNAIGLTDGPYEQYARTMSIPDEVMPSWLELATRLLASEVDAIVAGVASGELHAKAAKQRLAREIVARWHSPDAAAAAEELWERTVARGEAPAELDEVELRSFDGVNLLEVVVASGAASSRSEARRLIDQGGVRLDGVRVVDERRALPPGAVFELAVGKRFAARVRISATADGPGAP